MCHDVILQDSNVTSIRRYSSLKYLLKVKRGKPCPGEGFKTETIEGIEIPLQGKKHSPGIKSCRLNWY